MTDSPFVLHRGGCHCGAVRFEVDAPAALVVEECNCSICSMIGFWHLIVPASRFRLVQGEEALVLYTFGTHTAQHRFCGRCGVKPFYVPRSNPDGFSINVRCLDQGTVTAVEVRPFDGVRWEQNASALAHLSKEP